MLEGIIALIVAAGAAWLFQRGKQSVKDQQTREYADERKRQDEVDIGLGASDADRIKRLHDIARGGG